MTDIQIHDYSTGAKPQGQTWDTTQMQNDFEVSLFVAPHVFVTRKSDGVKGILEFTHHPRVYFNFRPSA